MKFRFCGDGDCPDWVLAGIHSNLSVLNTAQLKEVAECVVKCIILGTDVPENHIRKIFGITKGSMDTPKAAFACIRFLLVSAARFNTDSAVLGIELQQLGLPREHTTVMCQVLDSYVRQIRTKLHQSSLTINELRSITSNIPNNTIDCVQIRLDIKNEIVNGVPRQITHEVNINRTDIPVLLKELKIVRSIMNGYDYGSNCSEEK
ncbi:COMM domain-containing protein 4 [Toxorhynchites rutilus septentrionalis]|uniref:COMM domain-containing protein 4 n=1 Tax=Toxorhynchites rutilus septentrionalis TaxID=329112 RepID=UPI00247A60DA|nr:COMM domain-containing protein 4 [Toxorhynchites rutilus septentrionalis]